VVRVASRRGPPHGEYAVYLGGKKKWAASQDGRHPTPLRNEIEVENLLARVFKQADRRSMGL
jgi:hypothetical protein